jgi:hypothetical protein
VWLVSTSLILAVSGGALLWARGSAVPRLHAMAMAVARRRHTPNFNALVPTRD